MVRPGLVWSYAFHHEEAVSCFEAAVAADPDCAMAHWGIAYALGPNYNKPWEFFDGEDLARTVDRTHAAVELAQEKAAGATPVEQALIGALRARYPQAEAVEDCSVWNEPYADSMRAVYELAPDDLDIATLYADALMNLTPWQLWDLRTGEPAEGARTLDAKAVLERAIAHRGGGGIRASCTCTSTYGDVLGPETALPVADRLRGLVPTRAPAAHAHTPGRALRRLPARGVRQQHGHRRRREVPREAGADELLHPVPVAQLPLQDLRRDVPRPVEAAPWRPPPNSKPPSRRTCCACRARPWRTGSRPSSPCGSTR